MHGCHWLAIWSVMREVRDLSSCESEFHGKESGAVRESLMNYICRKDREQTEKNFQFTATQWQVVWYNDWVREDIAMSR